MARPGRAGSRGAPLSAVTFDFWNTLMWEEPGSLKAERLGVWSDRLAARGMPLDPGALERAHDAAHQSYVAAWKAGRQFVVDDATAVIVEQLDGALPADARPILLEGFDDAGRRAAVYPSTGVASCLRALKDAGLRIGIICDIGLTRSAVVRELLDGAGLLPAFDHVSFSDEVGAYKPSEAIFNHALGGVGPVEPAAAAHVGDRVRTDVGGARRAGMRSVRYNGVYEDDAADGPEADIVIDDLARLPAALGIGG